MPVYAFAVCGPRGILHMVYGSPMEERGALCILIVSKRLIVRAKYKHVTCNGPIPLPWD
jgi:hypothetical protein